MFIADSMPHHITQIEIMHRLKEVGLTQEQAETHAQLLTEVSDYGHAAKQEIKQDTKILEKSIEQLDVKIERLETKMENEFTLVRKDMDIMKFDLTVRMTVIVGSLLTLFSAIQKFLLQ